jgi:tetratricopeptide (TPR) repeat protein
MSKRKHALEEAFRHASRLHAAGRLAEAEQMYRQILGAAPRHADSLHMLGLLALQAGQAQAAIALIDQAIALHPSAALCHVNRAASLHALGRSAEALAACREALRHKRNCAEAYQALGRIESDLGRPEAALDAYREAMRHKPDLPDLVNGTCLALCDANRFEEAAVILAEALRRSPGNDAVRGNLAGVLKDMGRLAEAETLYREALDHRPDDPLLHYNLALLLLLDGRWREGWIEWEWRLRARPATARALARPLWRGEPLARRRLLVHAAEGLGDTIQFARFVRELPADGTVLLDVQKPLVRLLAGLPGTEGVFAIGEASPPPYDLHCPLLSLPHRLGAAPDGFAEVPYLTPDPALVPPWQQRVAALGGLRVGLAWAGSTDDARLHRRRSIPLDRLAPLAAVPGVSLVSLQKDGGAALAGSSLGAVVHDWTEGLADFADTAALVQTLDLVIAVDTAVAHLAGALGKPVWLLNRFDTCWRWLLNRDDSPWYPTLRQFRQSAPGAWDPVIAAVCAALSQAAADAAAATRQAALP